MNSRCSRLLQFICRTALPPSLLLRLHRCLAFELRALEQTMSLLVALEAESLVHVSLALLSCHRVCKRIKFFTTRCLTTSTIVASSTSTSAAASTATFVTFPDVRGFLKRVFKVALACRLGRWASSRPCIAEFRRICNDVVEKVLQLYQSNLVFELGVTSRGSST